MYVILRHCPFMVSYVFNPLMYYYYYYYYCPRLDVCLILLCRELRLVSYYLHFLGHSQVAEPRKRCNLTKFFFFQISIFFFSFQSSTFHFYSIKVFSSNFHLWLIFQLYKIFFKFFNLKKFSYFSPYTFNSEGFCFAVLKNMLTFSDTSRLSLGNKKSVQVFMVNDPWFVWEHRTTERDIETEKQRNNREIERYSGVKWLILQRVRLTGFIFGKILLIFNKKAVIFFVKFFLK